jgi:hypothetical protein
LEQRGGRYAKQAYWPPPYSGPLARAGDQRQRCDASGRYLTENKSGATVVSREQRGFDNADRVLWIEHQQADSTPRLRIEYVWNADNTVASRTERDYDEDGFETGALTVVYQYDNRQRLLRETATDP